MCLQRERAQREAAMDHLVEVAPMLFFQMLVGGSLAREYSPAERACVQSAVWLLLLGPVLPQLPAAPTCVSALRAMLYTRGSYILSPGALSPRVNPFLLSVGFIGIFILSNVPHSQLHH
jgi:hypothetical protein